MAEHNDLGQKGELLAAQYLSEKNYEILETNWRFLNLEADIIALKDKTLVVAEVKTRKSVVFGEPEVFVNKQKQKNLLKAANEYVQRYKLDFEVRFDIVSVIIANGKTQINHIEDAFLFGR
jgi:putative endonuclease